MCDGRGWLDFRLLGNFRRVILLNVEAFDSTVQIGISKQQLDGPLFSDCYRSAWLWYGTLSAFRWPTNPAHRHRTSDARFARIDASIEVNGASV